MKLYGLFEYTYDWYEWETLICVSKSKEKLKLTKQFIKVNTNSLKLVEDADTHNSLNGERHYMIKEVEYI